MLNRTVYNIILLLIFAFGYELIHINYNGNEYMYLNSLCAGGILLSHIYVKDYVEGKSKFIEILPLPIALLTSCILFFSYILSVQNPTGHQIFLGFVIWLMYLVDLGIMDSLVGRNLEKNAFFIFLEKICLFLIVLCAIQINALSWFKITLLLLAFLYSFSVFISQMEKIPLQNNKTLHFSIALIDIYLFYLSAKMVISTPDDHYRIALFVILLLSSVAEFNKAKVTDSQQALAAENTNKETNTSKNNETEVAETIDNREVEGSNENAREDKEKEEEDDIEDEEEDDFDVENATLKDILDRRITLDDRFNENITKKVNSLYESVQLSINNVELLEEITEELNELKEDVEDDYDDLSDFIDDSNDDFDLYAHEMGIEEAHQKINILIDRLEKKRVLSEMLIKMMEDINNLKEIATNSRNHEQQEKKTITKKRKYTKKSPKTDKNNSTDKKDQDEYIGRFIDLE